MVVETEQKSNKDTGPHSQTAPIDGKGAERKKSFGINEATQNAIILECNDNPYYSGVEEIPFAPKTVSNK